jgi:glycosyltransferase involved in cell wall biosynthesis
MDQSFPFFSIIIPSYCRAYCIVDTLHSIEEQSFLSKEVIIVDDGSTDNTADLIAEYIAKKNLTIQFIKNQNNVGPNISRNRGAAIAKGQYLVFLDSDDLFFNSESLKTIYTEIVTNQYPDLLMCACVDISGNKTAFLPEESTFISYKEYFMGKYAGEYLPVAKNDSFKQVKYYEDIIGGEHITWKQIAKLNDQVYISINKARTYNNINTDRLSNKESGFYSRVFKVHKKDITINFNEYIFSFKKQLLIVFAKMVYYKIMTSFER